MSDHVVVNEPTRGVPRPDLGELVRSRDLLYFLTWRDVLVRYKQTAIGIGWAVLQPVLTMLVFTVVFGRLASLDTGGVPYPVFAFSALVPWTFFANAVSQAGASLVANERLLTKVYFPRLVVPLAAVNGVLIDLGLASVVLVVLLLAYGIAPGVALLALPIFVLLAWVAAVGVGTFLAAVNVRYRDVRYVIPFLVQVWLFVTPVAYSSELVPDVWRIVYGINPMAGVVDGFRWALLGEAAPGVSLVVSAASAVVLFAIGMTTFARLEETFADEI